MVTTANLTLCARRGDDLRSLVTIRDPDSGVVIPTSAWTARMQVRPQAGDTATPLLDLQTGQSTTAGSGLSFDADGIFEILIKAADIAALPIPAALPADATFAYDVKMRGLTGDIETYLAGVLVVATPVTLDPPPSAG